MLAQRRSSFLDRTAITAGAAVALLLVWRVLAAGLGAAPEVRDAENLMESRTPEVIWREKIAADPTDAFSLLVMGLTQERQGKRAEAGEAIRQAVRLAPADQRILLESAGFYLRDNDEPQALTILRRAANLYPEVVSDAWPVFAAALESGRQNEFFLSLARENPKWWPRFFQEACAKMMDAGSLLGVFSVRAEAGTVTEGERGCLIGRMQREGRWTDAYQIWLNSLPQEQRRQVGYVFNGSFESAPSNVGFDWITPTRDGAMADAQSVEGAQGRRALRVVFVNKRFAGPPIYQYLVLQPGRYQFEGMVRPDGLETWLGLQWGLYCVPETGKELRQLVKSERFLGAEEWLAFRHAFVVPADCAAQVLQLELANPRHDAETPGNVAARLRGTIWFDDLKIVALD